MFNVSVQTGSEYLLIVVSGPAGATEFCSATSFLSELVRRTGCPRVMLDMLALAIHLDKDGDLQVLQHLAATMPPIERLAVVVQQRDSHGLLVRAAAQRGVDAREFGDLGEAEAWIQRGAV